MAELVKGVAKLALVGYMAYISIKAETGSFARLTDMEAAGILVSIGSSSFRILLKTSGVLVALAALDYGFQRWELEKSLSMTRHEVKEEFKETEGQPLIKSRVRSLQRQLAKKRMMQDVPKATAVITNPTHLAVALRYEHGSMRAPVVVAKGAGLVAERIKDIARTSGVPLIENRPLAQALWKTVEIGKEIPASLFKAVAEVLAYVYRLRVRR
ncbi:MAG: EscU/YscU/HrcU family type III secretion system export apparatus switch protein [Deltaproteobacteria bacterium]|nr:EscU/YscU/HrcU family type III secretion system export apparatus switch protein [Deltaproteobacteria bacterium]